MTDDRAPHDAAWYARHADAFGWGPATARADPERMGFLERWVVGSVLDVGCATGVYVDALAQAGHEARGVDHSEALVAWARGHRRGTFDVGDAYALPHGNGSFDTVLALDVLEHVDDVRALAEIARVARRRVIVGVPARTPDALLAAGLLFRHHEDPSHRRVYGEDSSGPCSRPPASSPARWRASAPSTGTACSSGASATGGGGWSGSRTARSSRC